MSLTKKIFSAVLCAVYAAPMAAQQQIEPAETETEAAAPAQPANETTAPATPVTAADDPVTQEAAVLKNNVVDESIAAINRDIRRSNFLPFSAPQMVAMVPGTAGWKPNLRIGC